MTRLLGDASERLAAALGRGRGIPLVLGGGALAVAVRLPFLSAPLGSDEGGYLLVAAQWHAGGTSLYGNYWVDRPPLLIAFFGLADRLGGAVGLRVLGCLAAFSIVALSQVLARTLSERRTPVWPVVVATAFVCMPFARVVDGELVAVPLVLVGLICATLAWRQEATRQRLLLWASTGAAAAAAMLVKQNFLDVFVFSTVLVGAGALTRRTTVRAGAEALGVLVASGALVVGGVLGFAAARGTSPGALWNAVVVFRADAAAVLANWGGEATQDRLLRLVLLLFVSGAVVLISALLVRAARRPVSPHAVAAAALMGWELFAILAGGGYWTHYLVGLIPGLVVAVAVLHTSPGRMRILVRAAVSYALVFGLVAAASTVVVRSAPTTADRVAAWLRDNVQPGDTGVVMYGQPHILETAGLSSPYPELWSLPVRVRDPELLQLTSILEGHSPPTWVVAWNALSTWGIPSSRPHGVVQQRYRLFAEICGVAIYRLGGSSLRPAAPTTACPAP